MEFISIAVFVFLLLRLIVAGYNYFSAHKLKLSRSTCSKKISILIPARDEESNILVLLESIAKQSYAHYEVIILDDDSSDNTFSLADTFAKHHPKFKVIKGNKLPQGWTGKNYACWQLAAQATGDYLLFLDADVFLSPNLLESIIGYAEKKELSLLSLFSNQQMETHGEKSVVPLMNFMLLTLLPIKLIGSHPHPVFSAACGQLMLFKAEDYHQHQWHEQLSGEVTEDLKIIKLVKRKGFKTDALLAGELLSCRMYTSYQGAVAGFSKNFITPFNDSVCLFCLYLLTITIGPLLVFGFGNVNYILPILALILMIRCFTSASSGQNILMNLVYHPVQMANLLIIGCIAIQNNRSQSGQWKGRLIG